MVETLSCCVDRRNLHLDGCWEIYSIALPQTPYRHRLVRFRPYVS
jgi:hypothetical protein